MRAGLIALAVGAAAAIAVPATGATGPLAPHAERAKSPRVTVADYYYSPTSLTIKKGTKVRFKWAPTNTDLHDVWLTKGPKKLTKKQIRRDFRSATGSIGVRFNPTFERRGSYSFVCTLHRSAMRLTVEVNGGKKARGGEERER
ncbi:MAG: cupredoxin domain-containing protein [Thermoleophilia bacterium]|nr:cupredoxin domain-containing protein [Thermoleophilia bacterium]GIK76736.1 MAG: hypothetical protein BroJett022_04260 [Actinomycetes bacterium]